MPAQALQTIVDVGIAKSAQPTLTASRESLEWQDHSDSSSNAKQAANQATPADPALPVRQAAPPRGAGAKRRGGEHFRAPVTFGPDMRGVLPGDLANVLAHGAENGSYAQRTAPVSSASVFNRSWHEAPTKPIRGARSR